MKLLIFSTRVEIFLVFTLKKKSKFSSYFIPFKGKKNNFFPSHFSLILLGSAHIVGIKLGANGKWFIMSF